MLLEDDKRFLRSMRIASDGVWPDPLPPLPRFRVVPTAIPGWYRVLDGLRRRPMLDFGPENFKDPRAAAEDAAVQMNKRHENSVRPRSGNDDDGA